MFIDHPHLFGMEIVRQCVVNFRGSEVKVVRNRLRVEASFFD